ncbi:protein CWC15 [Haematococcus lacustris]|uniref:Protein CWC15 n=1 Tax=Haematococcus lacustris TaxID=44745 RepID=A0A6A0A9K8_HAELA|nr:protein CWC15 [Haematococcus lacustris]
MLKDKEKELVTGNPLLALGADVSFNMKRSLSGLSVLIASLSLAWWDEDVVFKNQARNEPKAQKRFINDTIRNDFHKRFLQRYIR